jgi:DNA-binding SARP family transcriptional activator
VLITLVDRIARMGVRCIRVVASAGWGKSTFARTYANIAPNTAIVDARGLETVADFAVALTAGLRAIGAEVGGTDVLADWRAPAPPGTIMIDGGTSVLRMSDSVPLVRTLLRTMPPGRSIILCSRVEFPIVWSTYFAPHEMTTIGADDLAIDADELQLLFAGIERSPALDERVLSVSQGWPIAVLLFARLAANGTLEAALDRLGDAATFGDLHDYVQAEIFDRLDDSELETLCAVVALGEGTAEEISLALGRDAEHELHRLAGHLRYLITLHDGRYYAVPLAQVTAESRQVERTRTVMHAAIERLCATGSFVRAAELALQLGDDARAVEALDCAGEPLAGFVPGIRYVRAAMRIGVDELARSRNVLTILLASPLPTEVDRALYERFATRWSELDENDGDLARRVGMRIALAYLSRFAGHFDEAERHATAAEREIAALPRDAPIVRVLSVVRASLFISLVRIDDAEAAWAASGEPLAIGETFFAIDRAEYVIMRGLMSGDVRTFASTHRAVMAEIAHWPRGAGARIVRMFDAGGQYFTTGHFPTPEIAAARAGASRFDSESLLARSNADDRRPFDRAIRFTAYALIDAALQQSDRAMALSLLSSAIGASDRLGVPLPRTLARVVAAAVSPDGVERERLLAEAAQCAAGPLRARVEQLRSGILDENSIFAPFLHGPAAWARAHDHPVNRVEVMRGRVICRGEVVRLRGREHELLVVLALASGPMSREALADRLWPDQDEPSAAGSLRSTLHRLRQQVDPVAFVERDGTLYRLAPTIAVDVIEAEALYNVLRRGGVEMSEFERTRLEHQFEALAHGIPDAYARWPWFAATETRLVDLRHGLGMLLAREDFARGRYAEASRWTKELIDFDPLDEAAAELHFQAVVRGGGRTEAARWLRRYRALLANEYGMEPSFELDRAADESGLRA